MYSMHHRGLFRLRRRYPHPTQATASLSIFGWGRDSGFDEQSSPSRISRSSVSMMHAVSSYLRRVISAYAECCEADSFTCGDRATSQTSPHFIRRVISAYAECCEADSFTCGDRATSQTFPHFIRRVISAYAECCEADSFTCGDRATSQTSPHFIRRVIEVVITRRS